MIHNKNIRLYPTRWDWDMRERMVNWKAKPRDTSCYIITLDSIRSLNRWLFHNRVDNLEWDDFVYFAPNAQISRTKFRDWARNSNTRITLNPSNADVIVLDRNILEINDYNIINIVSADMHGKPDLSSPFSGGVQGTLKSTCYQEPTPGLDYIQVPVGGEQWLVFRERELSKFMNNGLELILSIPEELSDKKYILAEDLAVIMQDVKFDFEAFENIFFMLVEGDEASIKVAIELMSNYNFKESIFYFGLLKVCYDFRSGSFDKVSLKPLKKFMLNDNPLCNISYIEPDYVTGALRQAEYLIENVERDSIDSEALGLFVKTYLNRMFSEYPVVRCEFGEVNTKHEIVIGEEEFITF